jgi:ubiquitin C-terminal hydrolase
MEPFLVNNAGNTCYIDSLLMGLFYSPSYIDELLSKPLKESNSLVLYLQEYIKDKFVNLVRNNKSVIADDIEMIKTLCFELGWRQSNSAEYIQQQDVTEFYTFLMELFENELIIINKSTISEGLKDKTDKGIDEKIPFVALSLPENKSNITIKELINIWLYDNISIVKRNVTNTTEKSVNALHTYYIKNIPNLIGLSINRFNSKCTRNETDVIIQKKISFSNNNFMNDAKWYFHAAICHRGNSNKFGHYYTLVTNGNNWYIFDDLEIPCMRQVKMDDKSVTDMIKKECFFILYKRQKFC